jgi:hypothetical protein
MELIGRWSSKGVGNLRKPTRRSLLRQIALKPNIAVQAQRIGTLPGKELNKALQSFQGAEDGESERRAW